MATLDRSGAEIAALAERAARGAGFPPAQSAQFGRAAALHLASGGDSAALSDALATARKGPVLRLALLQDDLARAMTAAGPDIVLSIEPDDVALAPAYVALFPRDVSVVEIVKGSPPRPARLHLRFGSDAVARPARLSRATVPEKLWQSFKALAARMDVPDSAESRARGAGETGA